MSAPTEDSYEDAAKAAYNAYCDTRNWRSFNNEQLPVWDSVQEGIKVGWRAAARAAIENYDEARTQPFPQQLAPETESATEADSFPPEGTPLPDGGESLGSVDIPEGEPKETPTKEL
jgi:hypothetical protein